MARRERLEIIIQILEAAMVETHKTALVYGVNLNFRMIDKYLDKLMEKGILEKRGDKYRITEKGIQLWLGTMQAKVGVLKEVQNQGSLDDMREQLKDVQVVFLFYKDVQVCLTSMI